MTGDLAVKPSFRLTLPAACERDVFSKAMQVPIEIAYHQVTKSEAIDQLIREKADHLEQFCDHIISCAVAVERPNLHQRSGNPYRVRVDLHVPPRHEIAAIAGQQHNAMHDDLETVVIDAFEKAGRQLKKLNERQSGETKTHSSEPVAVITKLNLEEGYGFVTDLEGRDIYFDRQSLSGHEFERLALGMPAVFTEEPGPNGPVATTLQVTVLNG
jgi:ribosomal subunit interface protein